MESSLFYNKTIYKFIFLAISILLSLNYMFWSIYRDAFYWINLFPSYSTSIPEPVTLYLGYVWTNVFGSSLLSVRFLSWLLTSLSLCIFYCFTVDDKIKHIHYLACAFIMLGFGTWNMYNPDTLTMFTLTLIAIVLTKITFRKGDIIYAILLSFLTAVSAASRITNILVVGVVLIVFLVCAYDSDKKDVKWKTYILYSIIYVVVSMTLYYVILVAFTGDVHVLANIRNYFKSASSSGHNPFDLIIYYVEYFAVSIILYVIELIIIFYVTRFFVTKNMVAVGYVVFAFLLCVFFFVNKRSTNWWCVTECYITFSILLFPTFKYIKQKTYNKHVLIGIVFVMLAIVCFMGSDTGIKKMFPFVIMVFPFAASQLRIKAVPVRRICYVFIVLFIMADVAFFATHNFYCTSIFDMSRKSCSSERLHYIYLTEEDNMLIDAFVDDLHKYVGDGKVVCCGEDIHLMYYVSGKKPIYKYKYSNPNDSAEFNEVLNSINSQEDDVYLFDECGISYCPFISKFEVIKKNEYYTLYKFVGSKRSTIVE